MRFIPPQSENKSENALKSFSLQLPRGRNAFNAFQLGCHNFAWESCSTLDNAMEYDSKAAVTKPPISRKMAVLALGANSTILH